MKTIALPSTTMSLALLACASPPASPPPTSTLRGQTVAVAQGALFSINGDADAVVVVPTTGGPTVDHRVGRRPHRLIATADRLYVSLRGGRAVAVLRHDGRGGELTPVAEVPVGHEPLGLALSTQAARLYVAVSLSDEVVVVDTQRLEVVQRWAVPGEPRGVVLHPSGRHLYVTTHAGVVVIDVATGHQSPVPLAPARVLEVQAVRVLGDADVSPDGTSLAVPVLDVDLTDRPAVGAAYYGPDTTLLPYVSEQPLDPVGGGPLPEPAVVVLLPLTTGTEIASVTYTPAGEAVLVASSGGGALAAFPALSSRRLGPASLADAVATAQERVREASGVAFGPSGELYLARALDLGVTRADLSQLSDAVDGFLGYADRLEAEDLARWDSGLPPDVEAGRRLFHDVRDRRVSDGRMACATCHPAGRTDGITWRIGGVQRQTRTLAERVSDHTPLGWSADRADVAQGATMTSRRMGGTGLSDAEARSIQAFVDALEPPDTPRRGLRTAETTRGAEVFAELGCASCHGGASLTDRAPHALADRPAVATPSLRGVVATPPYLHDGTLPTLEAVVAAAPGLGKGRTDLLSAEDRAALLAYLGSL